MGYRFEPPNLERCHRAGVGLGRRVLMGVFVGEDGIVGDKEKAMWDKTLKRGKEFSQGCVFKLVSSVGMELTPPGEPRNRGRP